MKKITLTILLAFISIGMSAAPEFGDHYYLIKHKNATTVTYHELDKKPGFISLDITLEAGDIIYGAAYENSESQVSYHYAPDASYSVSVSGSLHCTIVDGQPNLEHGITVEIPGEYSIYYDEDTQTLSWTAPQNSVGELFNNKGYVDLGLKDGEGRTIYWATCNLGASTPYEYGSYFRWGELEAYAPDTAGTYEFIDLGSEISGTQYDAARHLWGGEWRMPTSAEMEQLCNNCTWTYKTINGINGQEVTGPNGNTIFLPAAGTLTNIPMGGQRIGIDGCYWTSTCYYYYNTPYFAEYLSFTKGSNRQVIRRSTEDVNERHNTLTIRPVLATTPEKEKEYAEKKAAEEAANAEAESFRTSNSDILSKTVSAVTASDLKAINDALEAYDNLSEAAKTKLAVEKALLDEMKNQATLHEPGMGNTIIVGDMNGDGVLSIEDVTLLTSTILGERHYTQMLP